MRVATMSFSSRRHFRQNPHERACERGNSRCDKAVEPPKPTTALLLSEIQVIGISRSPRGYAAIIEAVPIKLTYVIYPGEPFFDGQLVAIEDNRLVFRRETVFTNGRRERAVEYKQLRQPTPVNATPTPGAVATAKQ